MNKFFKILPLLAILPLAMCSSDKDDDNNNSGGNSGNSSSGTAAAASSSSRVIEKVDGEDLNDVRDGKKYKTIIMGTQVWMAENLNYDIPGVSRCYDDKPANCDTYGMLYDWVTAMDLGEGWKNFVEDADGLNLKFKDRTKIDCSETSCAVMKYNSDDELDPDCEVKGAITSCTKKTLISKNHKGICPAGWHLPDNLEWDALFHYADGTSGTTSPYSSEIAGLHLKAADGGWGHYVGTKWTSAEGFDSFGFKALPGGACTEYTGACTTLGQYGNWWAATEYGDVQAYTRRMNEYEGNYPYRYSKKLMRSIRCVKND